jgi:hypothetical protein
VNREELGNLGLTSAEEDDIVAFLKTLSDGYVSDLTGAWTSFTNTCKETKKGIKCKVKGKLNIQNIGAQEANFLPERLPLEVSPTMQHFKRQQTI